MSTANRDPSTALKAVTIYTDGACLGNPGPGGFGVVLLYASHRKELAARRPSDYE
jgi:ribonuclease HI